MSQSLHLNLEKQLVREVSLMREILSLIHQIEYALLAGDSEMENQLEIFAKESTCQMIEVRQIRIELTAKILKWPSDSNAVNGINKLNSACCALLEQLELLEFKIEDQKKRNELLSQAIDTQKEMPQATPDSPMLIQPVYSKSKKKPLMLTIDFLDEPPEKE